jgi:3-phenylpropionate/cinnamic acid dioxygenase small subunit
MSDREDRQDIADLMVRYATAVDRRDWRLFRTVFTEDCQLDYDLLGSFEGIDAFTDFVEKFHAPLGHTLHRMTNQTISVEGDRAEARTYGDLWLMSADNKSGANAIGFYDDEINRTHDGWRIARRRFTMVRSSMVNDS